MPYLCDTAATHHVQILPLCTRATYVPFAEHMYSICARSTWPKAREIQITKAASSGLAPTSRIGADHRGFLSSDDTRTVRVPPPPPLDCTEYNRRERKKSISHRNRDEERENDAFSRVKRRPTDGKLYGESRWYFTTRDTNHKGVENC